MATSQEHISFDTFVRRKRKKKKTFMEFSLLIWSNVFVCWLCELVGFFSDFRWLATFQYENSEYFGCNLKCISLYLRINQMWMCIFFPRANLPDKDKCDGVVAIESKHVLFFVLVVLVFFHRLKNGWHIMIRFDNAGMHM